MTRLEAAGNWLDRTHAPEVVAATLAAWSIGYGLHITLFAATYRRQAIYDTATTWANPALWGVGWLIIGALIVAALSTRRAVGIPLGLLGALQGSWAYCLATRAEFAPSDYWTALLPAALAVTFALIYGREARRHAAP